MKKVNTVILFWNPAISSYTLDNYERDIQCVDDTFNWSVWEYEKAYCGDRFFLVRCGEGNTGICMSGKFTSSPYRCNDWSGRGRKVYYMDMLPDVMIHPEYHPILTTEELKKSIPNFDWTGGHSGRIIKPEDAELLEKVWQNFLAKNNEIFRFYALRRNVLNWEMKGFDDNSFLNDPEPTLNVTLLKDGSFEIVDKFQKYIGFGNSLDEALQNFFFRIKTDPIENIQLHFNEVSYHSSSIYEKALRLSFEKHKNQKHHGEVPYYLHPLRVSMRCDSDKAKIVALLHDIIEDTDETQETLIAAGFPKDIVDAVEVVTRRPNESYADFIARCDKSIIGRTVKIADLEDNMEVFDLSDFGDKEAKRLNKYLHAWRFLKRKEPDTSLIVE